MSVWFNYARRKAIKKAYYHADNHTKNLGKEKKIDEKVKRSYN